MAVLTSAADAPFQYLKAQTRWHPIETVFWLATLLPFFLLPSYLQLANQIAITALFALSLDLILGYAGIVSLGHAAFFGTAAYSAGLFSKFVWGEPLTGLLAGIAAATLLGYATSFVIARFRHLTLIMITLGLGLLLQEAGNSASWLTGGSDGLQGVHIWPLLGMFNFDLYGYTAYGYSLAVLFAVFPGRAAADPFDVRPSAARHPRKRRAHAGDRRAQPRAYSQNIHNRRGHRRRCRCTARADHRDGRARFARLRALG